MGFLGHRTGNTGGGAGTCVIDKPTECTTGSWLVLVTNTNAIDGTHVISAPDATWQLIIDKQAGTNGSLLSHMHVWMKKVLASEAGVSGPSTYTFTVSGGARTWAWGLSAWDGLDKSAPVTNEASDADGNASDNSIPCPTRSTVYADSILFRIATIRANAAFTSLGVNYNNRVQINPGPVNFSINLQDRTIVVPGTAVGQEIIATDVGGQHVGATIVLAPPQPVVSTLAPDGVAAQTGYADATTGNISRVQGDPDSAGGTGFTAS